MKNFKIIGFGAFFLALVSSLLGSKWFLLGKAAQPRPFITRPPNIVFILADDLALTDIAYMPNLNSLLIEKGASFENFFISNTLCCPSRATILRGQYAHNTKILTNGKKGDTGGFKTFYSLGRESSTLATWLQSAGYRTALIGKYLNGYPLSKQPVYIPPGWNNWHSFVRRDNNFYFNYALNENGKRVDYDSAPKDYSTDVFTRESVQFIAKKIEKKEPFFLYLAPFSPHQPATPAPRHADSFPGLKIPRTDSFNEVDITDKPKYIRNLSPLTIKNITYLDQAYRSRIQSLQAVDEGIQKIVSTLRAMSQLDNTYIFFTSDNGWHSGQHRLRTGKQTPYEEDIHVPLIVRGPGVAVKKIRQLVGNIDLAPTIADLAGADAASFCEGRSLKKLLNGYSMLPRKAYLLEHWPDQSTETTNEGIDEPPDLDQIVPSRSLGIPKYHGIRTERYT
ncbi:MAG: sulfatase [Thermosynechococcaceae cyanobacterium]